MFRAILVLLLIAALHSVAYAGETQNEMPLGMKILLAFITFVCFAWIVFSRITLSSRFTRVDIPFLILGLFYLILTIMTFEPWKWTGI